MPAAMIQRHSRDPSGMVTCATLKKSPSQAVRKKTAKNRLEPTAQDRRARRRCAAKSRSKSATGSAERE
jgi:hypothetical protein